MIIVNFATHQYRNAQRTTKTVSGIPLPGSMTPEERYKKYSAFVEHFQEKTGGSMNQQFANWVDFWCWENGYRISFSGGIVPERFWSKELSTDIVVRNNEVNLCGMPVDEKDLLSGRFGIS